MASNLFPVGLVDQPWVEDDPLGTISSLERRQRRAAEKNDTMAFYKFLGIVFVALNLVLLGSELYTFATEPSRGLTGAFLMEIGRMSGVAYIQLQNLYKAVGDVAWTWIAVVHGPDFAQRGVGIAEGVAQLLASGLHYLALALSVLIMYSAFAGVARAPLRTVTLSTTATGTLLGSPPVFSWVVSRRTAASSPEPVVLWALLFGGAMCLIAILMARAISSRPAGAAAVGPNAKSNGGARHRSAASLRRQPAAAAAGGGGAAGSGGGASGGGCAAAAGAGGYKRNSYSRASSSGRTGGTGAQPDPTKSNVGRSGSTTSLAGSGLLASFGCLSALPGAADSSRDPIGIHASVRGLYGSGSGGSSSVDLSSASASCQDQGPKPGAGAATATAAAAAGSCRNGPMGHSSGSSSTLDPTAFSSKPGATSAQQRSGKATGQSDPSSCSGGSSSTSLNSSSSAAAVAKGSTSNSSSSKQRQQAGASAGGGGGGPSSTGLTSGTGKAKQQPSAASGATAIATNLTRSSGTDSLGTCAGGTGSSKASCGSHISNAKQQQPTAPADATAAPPAATAAAAAGSSGAVAVAASKKKVQCNSCSRSSGGAAAAAAPAPSSGATATAVTSAAGARTHTSSHVAVAGALLSGATATTASAAVAVGAGSNTAVRSSRTDSTGSKSSGGSSAATTAAATASSVAGLSSTAGSTTKAAAPAGISGGGGLFSRLAGSVASAATAAGPVLTRAAKKAATSAPTSGPRKPQASPHAPAAASQLSQAQYLIVPPPPPPPPRKTQPAAGVDAAGGTATSGQPVRNAWLNPNPVIKLAAGVAKGPKGGSTAGRPLASHLPSGSPVVPAARSSGGAAPSTPLTDGTSPLSPSSARSTSCGGAGVFASLTAADPRVWDSHAGAGADGSPRSCIRTTAIFADASSAVASATAAPPTSMGSIGAAAGAAIGEPVAAATAATALGVPASVFMPPLVQDHLLTQLQGSHAVGGEALISTTLVSSDLVVGPLVAHKHASGDLDIANVAANYWPYPSSVPSAAAGAGLPLEPDAESADSFSLFSKPPPPLITAEAADGGVAAADGSNGGGAVRVGAPAADATAASQMGMYGTYGAYGKYVDFPCLGVDPVWAHNQPSVFGSSVGSNVARPTRLPPPGFPSHAYGGAFAVGPGPGAGAGSGGGWDQPPLAAVAAGAAAPAVGANGARPEAVPPLPPAGRNGVLASLGFVDDGNDADGAGRAAGGSLGGSSSSGGGGEDAGASCAICWSAPRQVGFLHGKTSHLCVCRRCAAKLREGVHRCPMCRQLIERIIDIY